MSTSASFAFRSYTFTNVEINYKEYQDRIYPYSAGKAYLDLKPPVQICICDRSVIGMNNFKVVFPIEYAGADAYTF